MTQRLDLPQSAEKELELLRVIWVQKEKRGQGEEQAEERGEIQLSGIDGIICAETTQFLRTTVRELWTIMTHQVVEGSSQWKLNVANPDSRKDKAMSLQGPKRIQKNVQVLDRREEVKWIRKKHRSYDWNQRAGLDEQRTGSETVRRGRDLRAYHLIREVSGWHMGGTHIICLLCPVYSLLQTWATENKVTVLLCQFVWKSPPDKP